MVLLPNAENMGSTSASLCRAQDANAAHNSNRPTIARSCNVLAVSSQRGHRVQQDMQGEQALLMLSYG